MFLFEKVFSSVMLLIAGWESFRHSDVVCFCLTNVLYTARESEKERRRIDVHKM
jgi:hypothetical protein